MSKVHLAAHESMQPTSVHRVGRTEQMHVALIIASADEDHCPLKRGVEVEREAFGKHVAVWGAFPFGGGLGPVGGYIALERATKLATSGQWCRCQTLLCQRALKPSMAF